MLTEQRIEELLKQMTPLEKMMKRAYEAGDDILGKDAKLRKKYAEDFLRDCEHFDCEHPLNRVLGHTFLRYRTKEDGGAQRENLFRRHMTHEDYELGNGKNIQIVRHNRYAAANMHDHEFIEMSYVMHGSCRQEISSAAAESVQHVELKEGDLMILPPGMQHAISVFDGSVVINILMNTNTFERVFLAHMPEDNLLYAFFRNVIFSEEQSSFVLFETREREEMKRYVLLLIAEYVQVDPYGEKTCEYLLEILFLKLMEYPLKPIFSSEIPEEMGTVAPMILYLQEHFARVSLGEAAEKFHYSKASMNRIFKKYTKMTVMCFVRQLRLQKALELLETTDISVQKIAEMVGYEDVSYFIGQFKKRYRNTPLQMRKKKFLK